MARQLEVFVRSLEPEEAQRLVKITRTTKDRVRLRRAGIVLASVQGRSAGEAAVHYNYNRCGERRVLAALDLAIGQMSYRAHTVSYPVAPRATSSYRGAMSGQPEINQRDLRTKSKEIMDAVQNGQSFTVTRDGHRIGELVPLRRRRRFVPRAEFAAMSRTAPGISDDAFRADQDASADQHLDDLYDH